MMEKNGGVICNGNKNPTMEYVRGIVRNDYPFFYLPNLSALFSAALDVDLRACDFCINDTRGPWRHFY